VLRIARMMLTRGSLTKVSLSAACEVYRVVPQEIAVLVGRGVGLRRFSYGVFRDLAASWSSRRVARAASSAREVMPSLWKMLVR
jgi:hypothetical protein